MLSGAPGRKYLPSELSIKRMHEMFQQQDDDNCRISYRFYLSVFHYHFNLGFGVPATDVCSTCVKHKLQLKDTTVSPDQRTINAASFMQHRRRARMFYDRLNAPQADNSLTICFDLMENLVLPRTPIGQAYYSRQLYMYVFAIVIHTGQHSVQSKENVMLYTWREDQGSKDSNMTASAVHHALTTVMSEHLLASKVLRLFSDSCYGQNKNMAMLSMLFSIAAKRPRANPLVAQYNFPVRGHSFLPADRVFGRIEKSIRRHDTILLPAKYKEILAEHGTVFNLEDEWMPLDFKSEVTKYVKSTRSFKISEAKVLELADGKLGCNSSYSGNFEQHTVLKKGKSWSTFNPIALPLHSCVKSEKRNDVLRLLNEVGASQDVVHQYHKMLKVGSAVADSDDEF